MVLGFFWGGGGWGFKLDGQRGWKQCRTAWSDEDMVKTPKKRDESIRKVERDLRKRRVYKHFKRLEKGEKTLENQ